MKSRKFGNSNCLVSEIGLGCWQLGADWGSVDDFTAQKALETAVENGVTFFDTADVYGCGRSEELICKYLKGTSNNSIFRALATRLPLIFKGKLMAECDF